MWRTRSRGFRVAALASAFAGALWVAATGCGEPPGSLADAGDAGDGALPEAGLDAGLDAEAVVDARPDAVVPPDAILHDFCDEPYFKLPIDGQTEATTDIDIAMKRVVWNERQVNDPQRYSDVHLLDLETCIERQLTAGSKSRFVHISGSDVVWDDSKAGYDTWCTDLYRYDLATTIQERLTETSQCELEPKSNGRHVVYRRKESATDPTSLRLLDRQTGDDIELSPYWTNVESFGINERYVVWVAYTQDAQSVGRDVFYRDLMTGLTHHLDATYPRYQYWVFLWDHWVTVQGNDAYLTRPSFMALYNLDTQEERSLVEGDYATASGPIDRGLVVWNTSEYTGTQNLFPADMVLYDIGSTDSRRLTTHDGDVAPTSIASPFLLIIHRLYLSYPSQNDFYIANLEALGVIDATGNLLPGGPVITPP